MKLRKVTIRNFRAIDKIDLILDPQLTVLIGDNAAGKTCILDAISQGLETIAHRAMGRPVTRTLNAQDIRRVGGQRSLFAMVQLETPDGVVWDRMVTRDRTEVTRKEAEDTIPRRRHNELLSVIDPVIAARSQGHAEPPLPVVAYYGTDRSVVKDLHFYLGISKKEESRQKNIPGWQEAFRGALNPSVNFHQLLRWFEAVEAEELRRRRDEDPNLVHPQLAAVRNVVELVIPGARNLRVSANRRLAVDLGEPDGHEEMLDVDELSGGYRTVLALVADLARRMALINPTLGANSEAVVLIDEVDLHLHPKWQQTVLDSLRCAFPNVQFIVSTHSEQVIAAVKAQHVVRLDRVPGGVSVSRPTSTYGATPDRVSEDAMGMTTLRRRDVTEALERYWMFITNGAGESQEALALRRVLDEWFRGQEPEMIRADSEIRRQKMVKKLLKDRP